MTPAEGAATPAEGVPTPAEPVELYIGNDLVDLEDPRTTGKPDDVRFMERIFTAEERATIATADDRDLELWCHWAAKEAAYKVVSKLRGAPPPFVHPSFSVALSPTGSHPGLAATTTWIRAGRVGYEGVEVAVIVDRPHEGMVHAFGFAAATSASREQPLPELEAVELDEPGAPWSAPREELEDRLSERELDAVHSRESAAVRVGARAALARSHGVDEARLQIVCKPGSTGRRPPVVLVDGEPSDLDVSLSHHGRWIGWAFTSAVGR